jgi:hypothetical protein
VVEAEVVRCEAADRYVPAAVGEWKRQIDAGWVRAPRSGWEADVPAVLARDPWSYTQPLPPDNAAGLLRLAVVGPVSPELKRAAASAE